MGEIGKLTDFPTVIVQLSDKDDHSDESDEGISKIDYDLTNLPL